jgi:hypothetical protein
MGIQNAIAPPPCRRRPDDHRSHAHPDGIAADSWLGGASGARTARRVLAVGAMLLGAVMGALLLLHVTSVAPLVLALALLASVAVAARRRGALVT